MKQVVLVDPHCTGHHLSYLRIYSSIMLELEFHVAILCSDTGLVNDYLRDLIADNPGRIRVCKILNQSEPAFDVNKRKRGLLRDVLESYRVYHRFASIAASLRAHEISQDSLVIFMWLDDYVSKLFPAFIFDRFFPNNWGGIYFHPSRIKYDETSRRHYRGLLHRVPVFGSSRLVFIGLFDEMMVDQLQEKHDRRDFFWLPDVAEKYPPDFASAKIREILKLAQGRKIVALLGSLGRRKNVLSFFDVVEKSSGKDVFFLCSGQLHKADFSEEELSYIYSVADDSRNKLYFNNEHVASDVIFDTLFNISNIIIAVYDKFPSSSNMITKAAMHGKPVIVSNEYLMGDTVSRYGLGLCVESGNSSDLCCAIDRLLHEDSYQQVRFSAYLDKYSREGLKKYLENILKTV